MSEEIVKRILSNKKKMLFESEDSMRKEFLDIVEDPSDDLVDKDLEGEVPEEKQTNIEESNSCICGSSDIVEEEGESICNDCGRKLPKELKEDNKVSPAAVIRKALSLWYEGKYEKAMNLCNKYGVSDREFIDALVKSFRESDEVKGEEVEDSNLNNLPKLEEDVIDGDSKDFDSRSVKSGDSVRFTRKGMTDVPVVGKRFKVGWLTGKCTSLTDKEAVMLVEDAELEVVAPDEKSNLEKNIIYAMQTPISTAKKPSLDAAVTESSGKLSESSSNEILKLLKGRKFLNMKTLDTYLDSKGYDLVNYTNYNIEVMDQGASDNKTYTIAFTRSGSGAYLFECDSSTERDILGESILKSMKKSSIKEAIKTLDSFEVKASTGQIYKVSYRNDHTVDIQGIRPYDDADYYWAKSDDSEDIYNIYYKGKRVKSVRTHSSSPSREVVRELEDLNKNIKSRIIHN